MIRLLGRILFLLILAAVFYAVVRWVWLPSNLVWAQNAYAMAVNGTWGVWESAGAFCAYWFYALWGRSVLVISLTGAWIALLWVLIIRDQFEEKNA